MPPAATPSGSTAYSLSGRTALVTGAAGLLGPQHAHALAEAGATVLATDIDPDRLQAACADLIAQFPGQIHLDVLDVASETSLLRLAERHDRIDILVNNAAIDPKVSADGGGLELSRLEHMPLQAWDDQIRIGLTGAFLCSRIFGSRMAERGDGVILNIASDLSVIAPDQRLYRKAGVAPGDQPVKPVTYSVIKSGLVGLTRYLASYWADRGVRVNALSPGGVFNNHPPEFLDRLTNLIPMGRMADVAEYRSAVQFLCSPASSYMTGQNIVMDGGRSIL
ncbi:SDR family oxidoreductase [Caulobacter sp. S45]|uniref:SDR family oxidoreductase n=1 Tax=Caulobacter sp. S45 TaxID=1641861 RepID=UPI00131E4FA6|nr:SDR family oxidoreductase [Caulobacter sp. S45]